MAVQLSVAVRNAMLDAIETVVGTSPILEIRSGGAPATCATADSGTLLASLPLPSDFMAAASSGAKAQAGTWQDSSANASGNAGHWRLKSSGAVVHAQGTVTATGGGGDLTLDSIVINATQDVSITSFTLNASNA